MLCNHGRNRLEGRDKARQIHVTHTCTSMFVTGKEAMRINIKIKDYETMCSVIKSERLPNTLQFIY